MNPFDIFIIVILVCCLIAGLFKGSVWELVSIAGVIIGFFAAYMTYTKIGEYLLAKWISEASYRNLLSFLIIFCSTFIVFSLLGLFIRYLLKIASLTWRDRAAGCGLGIVEGILIVSVLLVVSTAFLKQGTAIIKDSLISPHVILISDQMAKVVSKDMKHQYEEKSAFLKNTWKTKN